MDESEPDVLADRRSRRPTGSHFRCTLSDKTAAPTSQGIVQMHLVLPNDNVWEFLENAIRFSEGFLQVWEC